MDVIPINVNFWFSPYSFPSMRKGEIVDAVCLWLFAQRKKVLV